MTDVADRLATLEGDVERALSLTKSDGAASVVLVAVVEELGRKMQKARRTIDEGGDAREAVVEVEQAADSAKYAAEADPECGLDAKQAIITAHDKICVFKAKMGTT